MTTSMSAASSAERASSASPGVLKRARRDQDMVARIARKGARPVGGQAPRLSWRPTGATGEGACPPTGNRLCRFAGFGGGQEACASGEEADGEDVPERGGLARGGEDSDAAEDERGDGGEGEEEHDRAGELRQHGQRSRAGAEGGEEEAAE